MKLFESYSQEKENMEKTQKAVLNILEDYYIEQQKIDNNQKALLNILEDNNQDKAYLINSQKALINILEDNNKDKLFLENNQKAVLNILDDYSIEKARVERMNIKLMRSLKEVEQFAFIASHDLQEPLRTISNFVNLLQEEYNGKLDKDADEYLNFISGAATRMQLLIKDLLNYSRIGRNENKTSIDCNVLVRDVLSDLATAIEESNAEIHTGKLPVVRGYTSDLKSLFQNLISNAIKFRKKDVRPVIRITAESKEKEWLFAIQDNGIGISRNYYDKIFTIFQRLHAKEEYPGTGIGLAQTKKIVELHGGQIWIDSEPGNGSTFYFTIPRSVNSLTTQELLKL